MCHLCLTLQHEFIEILVFYVDKFRRVCYAVKAYLGILQLCNFVVFLLERRDGTRNFAFWQDQLKTSIHGMQSPTLSGGRRLKTKTPKAELSNRA